MDAWSPASAQDMVDVFGAMVLAVDLAVEGNVSGGVSGCLP